MSLSILKTVDLYINCTYTPILCTYCLSSHMYPKLSLGAQSYSPQEAVNIESLPYIATRGSLEFDNYWYHSFSTMSSSVHMHVFRHTYTLIFLFCSLHSIPIMLLLVVSVFGP